MTCDPNTFHSSTAPDKVAVGVVSGVVSAASSIAQDTIDIKNGKSISTAQVVSHAVVSGVTSGLIAGAIGGSGARAATTHKYSKITKLFLSKSRKRLRELATGDCQDVQTFLYHQERIWNGF